MNGWRNSTPERTTERLSEQPHHRYRCTRPDATHRPFFWPAMSSSSRATAAASFAAGAAAALLSVVLYQQAQQRRQTRRGRQQQQQQLQQQRHTYSSDADTSTGRSNEQSSGGGQLHVFDSPGLDQRMIRKAEGAIRLRTSRLVIVIERCTNDHNYSAIHRTAEALGVQHIYVISPPSLKTLEGGDVDADGDGGGEGNTGTSRLLAVGKGGRVVKQANQAEVADRALHHLFAQRATEWLEVHEFDSTAECLVALREGGYRVWATDLSQEAVRLEEEDLRAAAAAAARGGAPGDGGDGDARPIPDRLAIVFGTEAVGCTAEMLREADLRVYLPLRGFADSLNLSVATALVVHHLFLLDPTLIGAMPEEERRALRKKWYATLCRQRLLSSGKKRERSRLLGKVRDGERCERIIASGGTLDTRQAQKLHGTKDAKAQLDKLDEELDAMAEKAVSLLVDNPPEPLSDMRRADEHRITHVGKGTKKKNADAWAGMPATAKNQSPFGTSSSFFRRMVSEANGGK